MSSWGQGWGQFDEFPSSQICINWRNVEPVIFLNKYWKNTQYEDFELGTVSRVGISAELVSCFVPNRTNAGAGGE